MVYTVDDALTALDAQTGERQWQTDLGIANTPNSPTQPAVAGTHLLLASNGRIASFNISDGSKRWERNTTGIPDQPVTVAPDRHTGFSFFERPKQSSSSSELVAFAIKSGATEWTVPLSGLVAPPAVFDDRVYVAGWAGPETQVLRCFGVSDGELIWERNIEDQGTPPIATEMGVLVGKNSNIKIYNHSDGKRLDSVGVAQGRVRAVAVDDGTALVLGESGLSAVAVPSGDKQWSLSGAEYSQADGLAVGQNTVVAPVAPDSDSFGPSIGAFSKTEGTSQWHYTIDDAFSPMIAFVFS
jgi:outer membrane protein assembly factor BamB